MPRGRWPGRISFKLVNIIVEFVDSKNPDTMHNGQFGDNDNEQRGKVDCELENIVMSVVGTQKKPREENKITDRVMVPTPIVVYLQGNRYSREEFPRRSELHTTVDLLP